MPSLVDILVCALVAIAFWSLLGYALTRHLLPRPLATAAAPVLGWAVHNAATLPLFELIGFSATAVIGVGLACAAAAVASLVLPARRDLADAPAMPSCCFAAAMALALLPAAAILPKISAGGAVHFSDPIFDHSKIAMIDAMTRQGLPPVNPVFGAAGDGGSAQLVYYYLCHFSAAQLSLPLGASGWEADIALTWFTAFASLSLMMGVAVWFCGRPAAAIIVVGLAAAGSLRQTLSIIVPEDMLEDFLQPSTGFAGWLFQSAWAPQHLMAASCAVTAMLLLVRYAQNMRLSLLPAIGLTVAAGFESSTYVGGITFGLAALAAAPLLLACIERGNRIRFCLGMLAAASLAAALVAPFVIDQWHLVAARQDPTPIVIRPYNVLDEMFPYRLRRILDLPAFWLIELPVEFPAITLPGMIAFWVFLRTVRTREKKIALAALGCLVTAGLGASWLLVSTVGDNNDLGLRAVLPAIVVLIGVTAAGAFASEHRTLIMGIALAGLLLSLPDTRYLVRTDIRGNEPGADANVFAQTPALWAAVRRYAGPSDRVANNPLFLRKLTPWPANLSWALLANRSSCFAGRELALALAPLPAKRREAINRQFIRVFAGGGTADDVEQMAKEYGCDVVVLVPQDPAWSKDPFAANPDYRLADDQDGRWKIYVRTARTGPAQAADPGANDPIKSPRTN